MFKIQFSKLICIFSMLLVTATIFLSFVKIQKSIFWLSARGCTKPLINTLLQHILTDIYTHLE